MAPRTQSEVELQCHPDTPSPVVVNIKTAISWERGKALKIVYTLNGVIDRLRIPPRRTSARIDGLWKHTCFELFIGAQNDAEYYEFNFSPSGEWALYAFRDYRDAGPGTGDDLEPDIELERGAATLELSGLVHADRLPGISPKIRLALGLAAVIEDVDGGLTYWALKHPPGKPDFHHADGFALDLTVPG